MKRLACIVLATALAGAAAPAAAKHIGSATVCGADGCRGIDHPSEWLVSGSDPTSGPPNPGPFVRLHVHVDGQTITTYFFPGPGMLLADDLTTWMRPTAVDLLRRVAGLVRPLPQSELPAGALPVSRPRTTPPPPASQGAPASHGATWWWIPPAGVLALALLWAAVGTGNRRRVYRLSGARHGRRPRRARAAR